MTDNVVSLIDNVSSIVAAIISTMTKILDGSLLTGTANNAATRLAIASIFAIPLLSGIASLVVRIVKRAR